MFESIIRYSIHHKLIIILFTIGLIGYGLYAVMNIPIGAVPDITNNQVQIITTSRNLATEDIEKFVTAPVELEMANLPGVNEIRSISKFGLSVVTIVFDENLGTYLPRQLIAEKIKSAEEKIPQGFGTPFMGPVSTGLGEIYQYILDTKPGYKDKYSVTDLRTIQDWIVKRQLSGISGVVEVNTWGGFLKTYEVSIDPKVLTSFNISLSSVYKALEANNSVAGGGYIEKTNETYFIRAEGLVTSIDEIKNIVVETRGGVPIYIKDVASVDFGHATRFGAITANGEGEKVFGQVMMLKGAPGKKVIDDVKDRVASIQPTLPEGVFINPILERSELISKTTFTISENLILGCLIVIFVVILLLGNIRSGLVVASVIPLCLLFAISLMYLFGVDANLMSLGAIDFGIIIDGAVIIVEYVAYKITVQGTEISGLSASQRKLKIDEITFTGTNKMMHSAIFGQLIILIVFIPILTLTGVEGKMFGPMAKTFCFALIGAMILCFTYVPMMSSLFIKPSNETKSNLSFRFVQFLQKLYKPTITYALKAKPLILSLAAILLLLAGFLFSEMGGEFVPTLDEGDFVIQPVLKTGMSLSETVKMTTRMEKIIKRFPEVNQVVSRIGAAEVPTDPMSMEESDLIITLIPKKNWTTSDSKDGLASAFKVALEEEIPGIEIEFTQPIEMRFNELITGVKADLAIKLFGEDLNILNLKGQEIKRAIAKVPGAADITMEKTAGLPQMTIKYDRQKIARYGLQISDLNDIISMGFAGMRAGTIFEGEKQFDLVIKYDNMSRSNLENIKNAMVSLPDGSQLPMHTFANIDYSTGPAKISRDDTKRRVVVGVNVRGRDLQSVVDDVKKIIETKVKLPAGYVVSYGGQFENLQSATKRLMIAVPVSLVLIFLLLYFAFDSVKDALIIYSAIPLASVGGIFFLYMRGMPFSISAGVGFIALFGIAVLNGIVLIEHFKELKAHGIHEINERIIKGTTERLRPVLLTATAAALGFLPMAISTSAGAEVQKPLATVVIGGLITATLLTLIVLPVLYAIFDRRHKKTGNIKSLILLVMALALPVFAQSQKAISLGEAIDLAYKNNLGLKTSALEIDKFKAAVGTFRDVPKTAFYYGFDKNNIAPNNSPLNVFGGSQSFKMPAAYQAHKDLYKADVGVSEAQYEVNKTVLAREISKVFYTISYWDELVNENLFIDSIYQNFVSAAIRKYELGESNSLEKMTAESKLRKVKQNLDLAIKNRDLAQKQLSYLLQSDEIYIANLTRENNKIGLNEDKENPMLSYKMKILERASFEIEVNKKEKLPEFNIALLGGFNSFSDFKLYPGVQFGVSVTLWTGNYNAKINAASINKTIQETEIEKQKAFLQNKKQQLLMEMAIYENALLQYEQSDKQYQSDLIKTASALFSKGEIDYFEYIQSIENATDIKVRQLHNSYLLNQLIVEYNYLLN